MLGELALGFYAITRREVAKFVRQRARLLSAVVRPSLWLLVFATGFQNLLGVSIIPPYETYTPYQEYILPGLLGMIVLFQSMQSALSMVYDREAGIMHTMLVSPLPRPFLLFGKIAAAAFLAVFQAYVFLGIASVFGYRFPSLGLLYILPTLILSGLMLGSIGLLISAYVRQIENFAGMMNFVIFPMFFLSSSLYPLWTLRESGADLVFYISIANPFTYVVELIRFAAYGQLNSVALAVVSGCTTATFLMSVYSYRPSTRTIRFKRRS